MAENYYFFQLNLPEIIQGVYLCVKVVWLKIKYGPVLFIAQNRIIINVVFLHNNCFSGKFDIYICNINMKSKDILQ